MTWDDVHLTEDQRDVRDMVVEWRESLDPIGTDDDVAAIEAAREGMVELGVWAMGMPEAVGGAAAELDLRLVAAAAVAGHSAALAWASAQAHAAAELLVDAVGDGLVERIAEGTQAVAVVSLTSLASRMEVEGERLTGTFGRVDAAGSDPALIVLDGDAGAWLLGPGAIRSDGALARTGLAGAHTTSLEIVGAATRLRGVDAAGATTRLRLGGAAIAAGLALDAAALATAYASSRVQFGAPLTALPTVRRSLDTQRRLAAESLTLAVGDDGSNGDRAASTLAGNLTRAVEVTAAALQSHGGYGYIEEYAVARLVRDAVSLRAATSVV